MRTVRLLVAWLLLAALPLQGMAAASMLFCGQMKGRVAAHQDAGRHHGAQAGHGAHVHPSPRVTASSHSDHGAHAHLSPRVMVSTHPNHGAHAHHAHAGSATEGGLAAAAQASADGQGAGAQGTVGDDRACPICASCCSLVVMAEPPAIPVAAAAPAAHPPAVAVRVATRYVPTPHEPPRA